MSNIHQFKGDEADVVIARNLSPDSWEVPDESTYDRDFAAASLSRVRHQLAFEICPATESFAQRKAHNERRVAYTALSRARDVLILIGESGSSMPPEETTIDPDTCLPAAVKRYDTNRSLDIWHELQSVSGGLSTCEWTAAELGLDTDAEVPTQHTPDDR
jgi:ATP-dependent exoDNAse (exonuclease V) beta subunit